MSEWKEYKLKDLTTKIGSGATPTGGDNSYKIEGISLIRSQNVLDFQFSYNGLAFIDNDQADELRNVTVQNEDVLLNITGDSVARVCKVPEKILPARVNQHVAIIRVNKEKLDSDYLLYNLQAKKEYLLSISEIGATRRALTKSMIEDLDFIIPPLPEQQSIASILSSLDDKIDLLHRQNKSLEALAEALFRQWFVEEAEEKLKNCQVYSIGNLIDTISQTYKFKESEQVVFLNTSDIFAGQVINHTFSDVTGLPGQAKKSIQKNDILYSEIRPANKRFAFIDFDATNYVVSTKLMVLRANGLISPSIIYFYLTHPQTMSWLQMLAEARSGTFPQITFDQVKEMKINVPTGDLLVNITAWTESTLKKICKNNTQIRTLTRLRDSLLPKLMSGDVRIE